MNGRAIRKRLMRHRASVLWGHRAYASVVVPMRVFPEPCPMFSPPEGFVSDGLDGHFVRDTGDEVVRLSISRIFSGGDPRARLDAGDRRPLHVEMTDSWTDEDGVVHESWTWWEGVYRRCKRAETVEGSRELISVKDAPENLVAAYRARKMWFEKYVHDGDDSVELLRRLGNVGDWARATYGSATKDAVCFTWAVKYFYPKRKLGFCAALHRAFKQARRDGVDMRMM